MWLAIALAAGLSLASSNAPQPTLRDGDGDGLDDVLEQALLERFAPRFLSEARECDELPARFAACVQEPTVVARDGTLYGQVFPAAASLELTGTALEIHYHHLWARDCGRFGHALDAEHVSALVVAPALAAPLADWLAVAWYAAAHEDTPCDGSNAARAEAIGAVEQGAHVWIARGKHGSYLAQELCVWSGCGSDSCARAVPLPDGEIVNLGERGAPLNGSLWTAAAAWPLAAKLDADFDAALLARLDSRAAVVGRVHGTSRPLEGALAIGGEAVGALAAAQLGAGAAQAGAGAALAETEHHVGNALSRSLSAVARALAASGRAVVP